MNNLKYYFGLFVVAALAACSSDEDVAEPQSVQFNTEAINLILGETETADLRVVAYPEGVTANDLIWTISNPSVCSFDGSTVKAKGEGKSQISAKIKNSAVVTSCNVSVDHVKVTGITLDAQELTLFYTATDSFPTAKLTATVNADAYNKEIVWKSSDETILLVDQEGNLTVPVDATTGIPAFTEGEVTITATTVDLGLQAECLVKVTHRVAEQIVFTPAEITMNEGETITFSADILPADAFNRAITWKCSNVSLCGFTPIENNTKCQLTSKTGGTVVITASTADGATATCTVNMISREQGINYKPYGDGKTW